jgi:hypothetical protein
MSTNGIFMATFYNKNTIVKNLQNRCFAAIPDVEHNTLTVTMGGSDYVIPCISYSIEELTAIFGKQFQVLKAITYPTISTLLSTEVLGVPEIKSAVLKLEDMVCECLWGHYIIIWCKKN